MLSARKIAGFVLATVTSIPSLMSKMGDIAYRTQTMFKSLFGTQGTVPVAGGKCGATISFLSQITTSVPQTYVNCIKLFSPEEKVVTTDIEHALEDNLDERAEELQQKNCFYNFFVYAGGVSLIFATLNAYVTTLRFVDFMAGEEIPATTALMILSALSAILQIIPNLNDLEEIRENALAEEKIIDPEKLEWIDGIVICDLITTGTLTYFGAQTMFSKFPYIVATLSSHTLEIVTEATAITSVASTMATRYIRKGKSIKDNFAGKLSSSTSDCGRIYHTTATVIAVADTTLATCGSFNSLLNFAKNHGLPCQASDLWQIQSLGLKNRAIVATSAGITALSTLSYWAGNKTQQKKVYTQVLKKEMNLGTPVEATPLLSTAQPPVPQYGTAPQPDHGVKKTEMKRPFFSPVKSTIITRKATLPLVINKAFHSSKVEILFRSATSTPPKKKIPCSLPASLPSLENEKIEAAERPKRSMSFSGIL